MASTCFVDPHTTCSPHSLCTAVKTRWFGNGVGDALVGLFLCCRSSPQDLCRNKHGRLHQRVLQDRNNSSLLPLYLGVHLKHIRCRFQSPASLTRLLLNLLKLPMPSRSDLRAPGRRKRPGAFQTINTTASRRTFAFESTRGMELHGFGC